ncbi:maleylacetoacetate isomerase [Burkholderiaceae bacterium DAT-1]|nr:maleylacetoacetate isomerase [Burkholderiaceae bacterium DAT-1]
MTLYTYFRSSAAWRVRIALAHKGLSWEAVPVHLLKDGGQQHGDAYKSLNPQGLVPALVTEAGDVLSQSLAIIEYLDEAYPAQALLPTDPVARAKVRSLALQIAADIHPINNLRVLQYLKRELSASQEQVDAWIRHWVDTGFATLETQLLAAGATKYCYGDQPSLADACLVPQVFNARRFGVDMSKYPVISAIDAHLMTLPAFAETQPARQSDAE